MTTLAFLGVCIIAIWLWVLIGALLTVFLLDEYRGPWPQDPFQFIVVCVGWPAYLLIRIYRNIVSQLRPSP